ncbi:MAG: lysophospholipid acyltransferase family protein [Gemmatimonas sp.]
MSNRDRSKDNAPKADARNAEAPVTSGTKAPATPGTQTLNWKTRAAIFVGGFLIRLLSRTWRIRVEGREAVEAARGKGTGVIFTFWHGQMLPLLAEHDRPTTVLISDHKDGEIITQIVRRFGCRAVRGSSSKGAARALLQLSRTLTDGNDIAITPDGPRGPRHSFAPGAVVLSQRNNAPIAFMVCHTSRLWRLKTWDQFEVPKPFARITVVYSVPFVISAQGAREATSDVEAVRAALLALGDRAAAIGAGAVPMNA